MPRSASGLSRQSHATDRAFVRNRSQIFAGYSRARPLISARRPPIRRPTRDARPELPLSPELSMPARLTTHGLGIALYLVAIFFFALNDALGKWLVADYGVGQLLMLRSVGSAFVLGPMIWRIGASLGDTSHLGLQILRIVCMALYTFCFYYCTRTMPLADVMTFYMATPLIITALSVPLLGERV